MASAGNGPTRPQMPAHLRQTAATPDPFAAPAGYVARPRTPDPRRSVQSAFSADSAAKRAGADGAEYATCPCENGHEGGVCGAATTMLASKVRSHAAARLLRCEACLAARHMAGKPSPAGKGDTPIVPIVKSGPAVDAEDAALDAAIRAELEAERWAKATAEFEKSLPSVFSREMDTLESAVEDRLQRLASGNGQHRLSLLAIGPYGSGKTWVSYSYARAAVQRRLLWPSQILAGTEAEIMEPLWSGTFASVREHEAKVFNPRLRMILIDDVGNMARYKDVEDRYRLYTRVVNHAWQHNMALIITTNLDMGQEGPLEKHIGTTAYERLRHMVGEDPILREPNRRQELTQKWEREYQESLAKLDPREVGQ